MSHHRLFSSLWSVLADFACRAGGMPTPQTLQTQIHEQNLQVQLRDEQQRALDRVISKIRASLDLETIFRTTTKETCKLLRVERVAVYRFFENWGGEFVSDFEFAEPGWNDLGFLGQNTVWNDTYLQEHQGGRYQSNHTLVVADVYAAGLSQCHLDILAQFHIRAYATAPIFIGHKLWGVLAAYQHSQPYDWQEQQIKFLTNVATHLGFAVKQSELLAQTQQKAEELQETYERQQLLFNLVSEIRETLDLDILFKTMVRETRKILKVDRVGIFQFAPDSNYHSGQFVAEHVLPAYDSALATAVYDHCFSEKYAMQYEQGRMQVIADLDTAELQECHRRLLKLFQIKAQIITPLMKGERLWGLLCVHQCCQPRQWKETEIQFIKQLAAQFSVALGQAELVAQYRLQATELDKAMQELRQSNFKLEQLTIIDPLTQVANRRRFNEVLDKEVKHQHRTDSYLSLILFDIDYFKAYNDYHGHLAGDACLSKIAKAVQSVVKRPTDLLARYGGEEFAVILPDTNASGAIQVAREIQMAVSNLQITCDHSHEGNGVTISLGITSQIPTPDLSVETLIAEADKALYQAKEQGRNTWVLYAA
ncbi:sensor domain-containing diguanylate cyclase [Pantanalinema sp. GBBB05]|uniref:sensor domain-containing diguanylate cyclase n=1 Tax=Pantanalinema sp. GBBB05 TaxID=2604139 RepID=UPI003D818E31